MAPLPCVLPAWHLPDECAPDDLDCLLIDFARTLDADKAIAAALKTCPEVVQ